MTAPAIRPHSEVITEVAEAAARLEAEGAVPADFLAHVRAVAIRLGAADVAPGDVRGALDLARGLVSIDVEAPATSNRRTVVLAKRGIRRAAGWYLRHLAQQVTALGEAILRAETAMAGRLETVEQQLEEVSRLRERVERLEAAIGAGAGAGPPQGQRPEQSGGPSGGPAA